MIYPICVERIYYSIGDMRASDQLPGKKIDRFIPYILHQSKLLIIKNFSYKITRRKI